MQVQAGDTVIFKYYGKGRTDKRGGMAVGKDDGNGVFVTTNPKGKPPAGMYVRLSDIVEVRPLTLREKGEILRRALVHGEGECKVVSTGTSYFKRSSGVRR